MNWPLLQNSLLVSIAATLLALGFGFVSALGLAGLGSRWRFPLLVLTVVALALPPFLVTNGWLDLLGQNGRWRSWLPLNLFSLGGTVWILALLLWPLTALLTLSAWNALDPSQLEADPGLQGAWFVRALLWPSAAPALKLAAILTAVISFNNFAVPAILQTKVYPAQLWVSFNTTYSYREVLLLSWPLLAAALIPLLWFRRGGIAWPRLEGRVSPALFCRQLGPFWFRGAMLCLAGLLLLSVALPLISLAATSRTWSELPGAFAAGRSAVWNTFLLAALTATLCTVAALTLKRWRFPALLWIVFLLPGVLLGIALIFLLNRSWLGAVYPSMAVVITGWSLRYFVLPWTGIQQALGTVDLDLTAAARVEGLRGWNQFRHLHWPQIAPVVASCWYVTYLLCLWDVETLVLIAPPGGETLALRIFNLLHYGHNTQVNALCLILLALATAPLVAWQIGRFLMNMRELNLKSEDRNPSPSAERTPKAEFLKLYDCPCLSEGGTGQLPGVRASPPAAMSKEVGVTPIPRAVRLRGFAAPEDGRTPKDFRQRLAALPYLAACLGFRISDFGFNRSWLRQTTLTTLAAAALLLGTGCDASPASSTALPHSKLFSSIQIIGSWGTAPGQLNKPRSLTLDREDNLYVVDMTGRVQKFSSDGKFLLAWQMPQTDLGKPKGMCRDAEGNILVIEPHYHRVNHFTPEGRLVRQWGVGGTNAGQLTIPRAAAINSHGEIFVTEYTLVERLQQFSPDGSRLLRAIGQSGTANGEFNRPEGVGIDATDRVFVADSCNHRIQVFAPDGKFLSTHGRAGAGPGEFSYPYDVQFDRAGFQFVCEFGNSRVQIFNSAGDVVEILGKEGTAPGEFFNPWSLALDSQGNLYVADSKNNRVQKFVRRPLSFGAKQPSEGAGLERRFPTGLKSPSRIDAPEMGSARALACYVSHPRGTSGDARSVHPSGTLVSPIPTGEGAGRNTRGRVCSPRVPLS